MGTRNNYRAGNSLLIDPSAPTLTTSSNNARTFTPSAFAVSQSVTIVGFLSPFSSPLTQVDLPMNVLPDLPHVTHLEFNPLKQTGYSQR
jgi:hypothetical protein